MKPTAAIIALTVLLLMASPANSNGKHPPPAAPTQPTYRDSFDGWQRHMAFHAITGLAARHQWPDEPLKAWAVAMIPGFVHELTAEQDKPMNRFSPRDMLSNAVGAAIGVTAGGVTLHMRRDAVLVSYATTF